LGLINLHHSHRGGRLREAVDGLEVRLGGALNRHMNRLGLTAFLPKEQLLTRKKSNQQRQDSPHALLELQRSDAKPGGTLTIHPEFLPIRVVIWLRRYKRLRYQDHCSRHAN
jgi:hypothetical protein